VLDVLGRHGYEPSLRQRGEIALVNCPFHRLAEEHRSLVCGMNLDFLAGLLEGMGPSDRLDARLEPEPGYCCVRIKAL
jgi:predicted ArsR family transcriptional regulator